MLNRELRIFRCELDVGIFSTSFYIRQQILGFLSILLHLQSHFNRPINPELRLQTVNDVVEPAFSCKKTRQENLNPNHWGIAETKNYEKLIISTTIIGFALQKQVLTEKLAAGFKNLD